MSRVWVWLQLFVGWLPLWALYSTMIISAHPGTTVHMAVFAGMCAITSAAALSRLVLRFTQRLPWPHPMRASFVGQHLLAALLFAAAWLTLTTLIELALLATVGGPSRLHTAAMSMVVRSVLVPFLIMGVWLYVMVTGVTYASQASAGMALAKSLAANAQLAALRSQLNPHFLFNALHTVVQLIPVEPRRASQAAEELAALLRTSLEETRDLVPIAEEWAFVERYLALERIRFGDRLQVTMERGAETDGALVPSFGIQTLVENAVRHGAAPRVEPTALTIFAHVDAHVDAKRLTVIVRDNGAGGSEEAFRSGGTGLSRLRDRLRVLFDDRGHLTVVSNEGAGCTATLVLPVDRESDS